MICGVNCTQIDHTGMKRYAKKLLLDITQIQKQVYIVNAVSVKFTVDLIPCDMKWLSVVAGELNNAAHYFSSFVDVNNHNKLVINGSLGENDSCT